MLGLLFAAASLVGLLGQLRRAGWSRRRTERRSVYWCVVGIGLGLLVGLRPILPYALGSVGYGMLGAALLYGMVADWQGWWRRRT
jgi:hypothetical protein